MLKKKKKMPILKRIHSPRGFTIVPVHYSADPERHSGWVLTERPKYATQEDWDREQEIDFRSVVGNPAYPNWSDNIHVDDSIRLVPSLPLSIACDFNVNPCIWEICQVVRGSHLHVLDEIALGPTDVDGMVKELRNRYPTHSAPVIWYGDATGSARTVHANTGAWDLIRLHMSGYAVPVEYRVPPNNPPVSDRLGAVSSRLRDGDGRSWVRVHPRCVELIADGNEVVYDDRGTKEKQVYDRDNPYHRRTHAFSAVGYLIAREWPLPITIGRSQPKRSAKKRRYGKLLGSA
ncbi:MAG: hypothetical protein ACR2PS_09875 [Pseudomonadales bacterium]